MSKNQKPYFLTVTEVSKILRIQRAKVYILIESGTLIAYKVGSDWRIPIESLETIVGPLPEELFVCSKGKYVVAPARDQQESKSLEHCF